MVTVNEIIIIKQLQQIQRIRACWLICILPCAFLIPIVVLLLVSAAYGLGYGLGSIPTIGTCAQRAPGPTAAQCYTSIVVLQSCISLFKPTCIGNISQSGVVIWFRPRAFLSWFCHHFCIIHVTLRMFMLGSGPYFPKFWRFFSNEFQ